MKKQLARKRTIGEHILKYGFVFISMRRIRNVPRTASRLGPAKTGPVTGVGVAWRKLPKRPKLHITLNTEESLNELRRIFDETGATVRFGKFEKHSNVKAGGL